MRVKRSCYMRNDVAIAVIGGSGVYEIEGVKTLETVKPETPFGEPSDEIMIAEIAGKKVAFLPRHGKGHRISPTELPVRANMYALKSLGVKFIIAISAVGSLKEEIPPEDFVVPSQIIDRTKSRVNSFFGDGIVGHVSFAEPFCTYLAGVLYTTLKNEGISVHGDETYVCMEGPLFSTKAESNLYRSWGAGVIGMTALPEAKLAREAEMSYAMIAMSTDYDCWREAEEAVTLEMVIGHMTKNTTNVKKVLPKIIDAIDTAKETPAHTACETAIFTNPAVFPPETKEKLELFYGKYWNK